MYQATLGEVAVELQQLHQHPHEPLAQNGRVEEVDDELDLVLADDESIESEVSSLYYVEAPRLSSSLFLQVIERMIVYILPCVQVNCAVAAPFFV